MNVSGSTGRNWKRRVTPMIRCGLRSRATAGSRLMRPTATRPSAAHILAYSDTAGAREEHSLIGSPAEIAGKLTALKAQGAAYVLLFGQGSRENMRRFAEMVMPGFAAK